MKSVVILSVPLLQLALTDFTMEFLSKQRNKVRYNLHKNLQITMSEINPSLLKVFS